MKQEEFENLPHILSVQTEKGIGSEISSGDDDQTLLLMGAMIVAAIKSMKEENRENALNSIRTLLKKYPLWIEDPELNKVWEEE